MFPTQTQEPTPITAIVGPRPIPILTRTTTLQASGEFWDGARLTLRVNPPMAAVAAMASGDQDRQIAALAQVVVEWNLLDEAGAPLPATAEGVGQLTPEVTEAVSAAWSDAYREHRAQLASKKSTNGTGA